ALGGLRREVRGLADVTVRRAAIEQTTLTSLSLLNLVRRYMSRMRLRMLMGVAGSASGGVSPAPPSIFPYEVSSTCTSEGRMSARPVGRTTLETDRGPPSVGSVPTRGSTCRPLASAG